MSEKETEIKVDPFKKQYYSIEIAARDELPFLQIFGLTANTIFDALDIIRIQCQLTGIKTYSIYTIGFLRKPTERMQLNLLGDYEEVGLWYRSDRLYYGKEEDDLYIKPDGCYFDGSSIEDKMHLVRRGYSILKNDDIFYALINASKEDLLPMFENFISEIKDTGVKAIFEFAYKNKTMDTGFYTAQTDIETVKAFLQKHYNILFNDGFITFGIANDKEKKQLVINEHKFVEYCADIENEKAFKEYIDKFDLKEYNNNEFLTISNFGHFHLNFKANVDEYEEFYRLIGDTFELIKDDDTE